MNKDQSKGRIEEVKGKAKEIAGRVIGDREMEIKGKAQNIGGKSERMQVPNDSTGALNER